MIGLVRKERWSFPSEAVAGVALANPAAPVAFSPQGYDGIVFFDGHPAAVFAPWPRGETSDSGRFALRLRTSRGLAVVRVDALASDEDADGADAGRPDGLAAVEGMAAGLDPAEALSASLTASTQEPAVHALIVASGGRSVAVPATAVERIDRHAGVRKPAMAPAGSLVVMLDGAAVAGRSLGARLGADAPVEEEWALVLRCHGAPFALTVERVAGMVSVPPDGVCTVRHESGVSVWITGAGPDPIELIDLGANGVAGGLPGGLPGGVADGVARPHPPPGKAVPDGDAGLGHLALSVGAHVCVVPVAMVAELRCGLNPGQRADRRGRRAIPLLDAAVLLGGPPTPESDARVLLLRRPGRCPVALLVARVERAEGATGWRPLPIVPPPLRDLFRALRPGGTTALEWLVRDDAADRVRRSAGFAPHLRAALVGWMENA